MKKLIAIGAVALCATVMGEEAAEPALSSGIVGYDVHTVTNGMQAMGGDFIAIGTNGCWLTDLKISGLSRSNGAITIQVLGGEGQTLATYGYYKGANPPRQTEGWYRGTTRITTANDVLFKSGAGLWVKGADGATITCAGEVLNKNLSITLESGMQMLSNPFPTGIKLTQLKVGGLSKSNGAVSIQMLGGEGQTLATYGYYKGANPPRQTEGWYRGTTRITTSNDVTLPAGTGLWVKGAEGAILTFEKPF